MLQVLILSNILLITCAGLQSEKEQPKWNVNFSQSTLEMYMNTVKELKLNIAGLETIGTAYTLRLRSNRPDVVILDNVIGDSVANHWSGKANISAQFIGNSRIYVEVVKPDNKSEESAEFVDVIVTREVRTIDHVFTGSVALLVSLLYINFGAALDLDVMKGIFVRPIGPAIGFLGQFLIMPLCSFALGYALFPDSTELQLGLFFTGVSPGGGASNIWTVILQGNMHLSIVMTTISTFAAFGMMPFWIFTLGRLIFERGNLGVPYNKIATFALALIIPLAIGVAIQKFSPKISKFLERLLKPIAVILICFIIVFAIVTNLYMFELFSWKIIVSGLALPWLGYSLAWCLAKLLQQSSADALTIAIETGIQNTGIAIFLLRFTLPQPQADLTTVIPVSVAIMTPIPLLLLFIYQRFLKRLGSQKKTRSMLSDSE